MPMREYGKIGPRFWIGNTGKKLKKAGPEAVVVGLYLITSPHSNMLGLYYQPELFIAHETGLGIEGASKGLRGCIEAGFCAYDSDTEIVWVYEMATYQIGESLSANDKRSIGVQNEYNSLPENPYLAPFFQKYRAAFNLTKKREMKKGHVSPTEAPSEAHRSQEQEQEQEQEKKKEANASVDNGAGAPPGDPTGDGCGEGDETGASGRAAADLLGDEVDDGGENAGAVRLMCPVERIVDAYHRHMPDNPRVKVLNDKRKRAIAARWREASKLDCKPFGYSTVEAGLSAWRAFFTVCAESAFLTGKAKPKPGQPPFIADIDFLMSPEAFAKCLENKYHRDAA
ncbi:hypothetical protein [Burkholderia pseudomallei]|uniref:hypothetical protein n=1 Tax=Burkholderia pseudomallei TaxID=28450 RepID=UPI000977D924|nr:hypothetical protein [Burkholderia pseudomallei]OMS46496.1 hypothetical protein AQ742_29460 [Burkholderia pseudomallei]